MSTLTIPGPSLRSNIAWTFGANLVYAACQWGMLIVLSKLGSPAMLGQFALGLAICTPIFMLANLQLRALQATDAHQIYAFGDYLGLRLITTILALLACGAVALALDYDRATLLIIGGIALVRAGEALSDLVYGLLQRHERLDAMARSLLLRGPLALLALTAGVALSGSSAIGCLAWALTTLLILCIYDWPWVGRLSQTQAGWRPRWERATLWRLARLSAPLGVATMLLALYASAPRFVIERQLGAEALGIFAAITYLERVGATAVTAVGQSASARLARSYAAGDTAAFRQLTLRLAGLGALLGAAGLLGALLGGTALLSLIYQPIYARQDVLLWVMTSAGLWYVASLLGYAATAARLIRRQPLALAAALGVTVLASLALVPPYGLAGAGAAMSLAGALAAALYLLMLRPALGMGLRPLSTIAPSGKHSDDPQPKP